MMNWFTPTLDPEEIDKRINELKVVQFWLDQHSKGIAATIQTLEVQKLTLATLQSMQITPEQATKTEEGEGATNSHPMMQAWNTLSEQFQGMLSNFKMPTANEAENQTQAAPSTPSGKKKTASKKKP